MRDEDDDEDKKPCRNCTILTNSHTESTESKEGAWFLLSLRHSRLCDGFVWRPYLSLRACRETASPCVDFVKTPVNIAEMNFDISHILDKWEYHPGQVVVRKFTGKDGQEKIQLRVDLGILQMNAEGRPDGKRPFGAPSYYEHLVQKFKQSADFTLTPEDVAKIQLEALQYHHRYICLLQLEDYTAVARDTQRNLEVFDFVEEHTQAEELVWALQQFRPQVLMVHTRARATMRLLKDDFSGAIQLIEEGVERIREFYNKYSRSDLIEQSAEIQSLQHWLEDVASKRPLSKREKLEMDLNEAVKKEDYERAARVRDELRNLKPSE
jgi:hypothetical protein